MSDIIKLLPDNIANQIAAGEVIQRPSSALKELLENSIDAGSSYIQVHIKDAGKSLIQVIDNGVGMSDNDARMCFERHATSKITRAEDLFALNTKGFRGEAMASIAAVAQVELKTKAADEEIGRVIRIEGSKLIDHEPIATMQGSSISIKNLFFNIPARRNFLKSDKVEMRHIMDEFYRVSMAHPDIKFTLSHQGKEVIHLKASNIRQRVVALLGSNTNQKLVPTEEVTGIVSINGFIGKPEFAKRSKSDQYIFVNDRFIKSGYLNHAIMSAYEGLIPKETHPMYVLFLTIDPQKIDINVHPTKQEIKFEDEKIIYNILKVAIKHALGTHHAIPSLDFDSETNLFAKEIERTSSTQKTTTETSTPSTKGSNSFKPTTDKRTKNNILNWQKLYEESTGVEPVFYTGDEEEGTGEIIGSNFNDEDTAETLSSNFNDEDEGNGEIIGSNFNDDDDASGEVIGSNFNDEESDDEETTLQSSFDTATEDFQLEIQNGEALLQSDKPQPYQIHNSYIVSPIKSGYLLIDQQFASERILYEQYAKALNTRKSATQKALFPNTIELSTQDSETLLGILDDINACGFEIAAFGKNTFIVHGVPVEGKVQNEEQAIHAFIEQFNNNFDISSDHKERVALSMAKSTCIKRGKKLSRIEMLEIIQQLFSCEQPYKTVQGKKCFIDYSLQELERLFNK